MDNIQLVLGDITTAKVDAIVNAANPLMLGGGGVDGAIHAAAGPALLEECYRVPEVDGVRCPTGEARITGAGSLHSRYVIHTVGPVYAREAAPARQLRSAYSSACSLALAHDCRSIAFPAISCGVFGYPHHEAAQIALATCGAEAFRGLAVRFYLFSRELFDAFERALLAASDPNNS